MSLDKQVFNGMTFSGLLEKIYRNQKNKDKQINSLIADLRQIIISANLDDSKDMLSEVMTLVPFVRDYVELSIKNDEQLIKMTAIAQRAVGNDSDGSDDLFDEAELEKISREAQMIGDSEPEVHDAGKSENTVGDDEL